MIAKIKEHLKTILIDHGECKAVCFDAVSFKAQKERSLLPIALITTGPGRFDNRRAKTIKYRDDEGLWSTEVRGNRKIPLIITVFSKDENQSYKVLDDFIPYVPRDWEGVHFTIEREEHTDKMTSVKDGFISVVELMCDWEAQQKARSVPVFAGVDLEA